MSGIAGFFGHEQAPTVLQEMVHKLNHRGPDAEGFYIAPPVYMGMRQLQIRPGGNDGLPFLSEDKQLAVLFAGELYNYAEERERLKQRGHRFRTDADAEVVLHLYQAYGPSCVNHMRGVFAFAVHDAQKDLVFMARDQLGVQPLYYTTTQTGSFVFASEIKSILAHPAVKHTPDMIGVDAYLSLQYSPGGAGMFKGIHALPAGHRLTWNQGLHVLVEPYWHWETHAMPDPALKTDADFDQRFAALLEESVRLRMAGGAEIGAFARPDLESAAILNIMAKNSAKPLRVYSVPGAMGRDGLSTVADMSARLGCLHEEVDFQPEYMDRLPELIWAMDEPAADPAVLLTHLMAKTAGQQVKTVMSGHGAPALFTDYRVHDALFGAHNVMPAAYRFMKGFRALVPIGMLAKKLGVKGDVGVRTQQRILDFTETMRSGTLQQQITALAVLFDSRDKAELLLGPLAQVAGTFVDRMRDNEGWPTMMATVLGMQREHFLTDGVLTPFNKMTMYSGISARLPFADDRLAGFLMGIPDHLRRTKSQRKVLLQRYVDRAMPGLAAPPHKGSRAREKGVLERCLAVNPLKGMIETCLSEASVKRRGFFDWRAVKKILAGAKAGEDLYMRQLFSLLVLEIWFRIFVDEEKGWLS